MPDHDVRKCVYGQGDVVYQLATDRNTDGQSREDHPKLQDQRSAVRSTALEVMRSLRKVLLIAFWTCWRRYEQSPGHVACSYDHCTFEAFCYYDLNGFYILFIVIPIIRLP